MAVAALGAMLAVVGCDKNKKEESAEPQKMSVNAKSSCTECTGAAKTQAAK
jgi:hypothetical protein